MKRIILLFILVFILLSVHGQAPSSFNYQAIVRDNSGNMLPSQAVSFRFSIIEGDTDETVVYTETHLTSTDEFGLVHLQIGHGVVISGNFTAIDWSSGQFFLKIELDENAGSSFKVMGTTQLLSVPYSMFSETSGKSIDKPTLEEVIKKGNNANYQKVKNFIIGNCDKCDLTTKGCIRYDSINNKVQVCNGEEWVDIITSATGLPEDAIYVSPDGDDTESSGTRENPCKSIGYGIDLAVAQTKTVVLVANGLYNETVELVNGISLRGGYDPVTWNRDIDATRTMISGTNYLNDHSLTILATNITETTLFQGFIIYGRDPVTPGHNSYAVYISGSDEDLILSDNVIYSGNGASGQHGDTGINGVQGNNGAGRDTNPSGYDAFITSSSPCSASNNRQYSNGGLLTVDGDNISGGNGGENRCSPVSGSEYSGYDGVSGQPGSGALGGAAGSGGDAGDDGGMSSTSCFIPGSPMTGANGTDGANGLNGARGTGGLISSAIVIAGHWTGAQGSNGIKGGNGGHGGGGGGGTGGSSFGIYTCNSTTHPHPSFLLHFHFFHNSNVSAFRVRWDEGSYKIILIRHI